jgi:hypothetical protein
MNIYLPPFPSLLNFIFSKAASVQNDLVDNEMRKDLLIRIIYFLTGTRNKQLVAFQN